MIVPTEDLRWITAWLLFPTAEVILRTFVLQLCSRRIVRFFIIFHLYLPILIVLHIYNGCHCYSNFLKIDLLSPVPFLYSFTCLYLHN